MRAGIRNRLSREHTCKDRHARVCRQMDGRDSIGEVRPEVEVLTKVGVAA